MPLAALRLVNPPRRGRKKNPSVRTVKTPTGTRYLKKVGSRWQFTSKPKTNPRFSAGKARLKRGVKKLAVAGGAKATSATLAKARRRRRRKAAARMAATQTRRRTTKKRITKRAASPRKRRTTVARKRTSSPRRPTKKVKARRKMKALWAKARRMGRKSIKGVKLGGAGPKRRKRRAAPKRRRSVSANPRRRVVRRRRRNPWTADTSKGLRLTHSRRGKKARTYRVVKSRRVKIKRGRRAGKTMRIGPFLTRSNPMNTIKRVLPIYGGFLAIRVAHGLFRHYVNPKLGLSVENEAKFGPLIPAGAMFLFATLVAPKIKPLAKNARLMEGIKVGAAFSLLDTIVRTFIVPMIPNDKAGEFTAIGTIKKALGSYDDVGVQGYGMGSYFADPTGYSSPPRQQTAEPGVGLDIHEAMALDEYIADGGMGYDVSEVLAGTEIDYMQRGGAGGSLSKTVFTD